MARQRTNEPFFVAHALKCGIAGVGELMDALLEELRYPNPITAKVESVCVLLELIEGKAAELVQLCDGGDDDGQAPQAPGA